MNKFWKTHKVVLLPTNNINANICKYLNSGRLAFDSSELAYHTNQYLYILSDDKILEGDWFIFFGDSETSIHQFHSDAGYGIKTLTNYNAIDGSSLILSGSKCSGKIIASTNPDLNGSIQQSGNIGFMRNPYCPSPSNDWLKSFCDNPVDEVEIQYSCKRIRRSDSCPFYWRKMRNQFEASDEHGLEVLSIEDAISFEDYKLCVSNENIITIKFSESIEEAAKKYNDHDGFVQMGFIIGAKSEAAKQYWFKQFNTK